MNWEIVRDQYYITLTTEACSLYGSSNKLFEKNVYSFHRSQGVTSSLLLEVGGSMACTKCEICPEGDFQSPQEDIDLETELKGHSELRPIPIPEGWPRWGLEEFFFQCTECGQQWYHAHSDFPFKGMWAKVNQS